MQNLRLRPATPEDSEFAYQTKKAAFREYADRVWGWDDAHQRTLHETRFASQDFRIIQLSGIDVGVLAVQRDSDRLRLHQLFILPDHQSKGIGTACMQIVIEEACRLRLPINLQILAFNLKAITFYARLGFNEVDRTETHVQMRRNPD